MKQFNITVAIALLGFGLSTSLQAIDECCVMVSKDLRTGLVTVRDIASGRTYQFQVNNIQLLNKLNPGVTFGVSGVTGLAVSPGKTAT